MKSMKIILAGKSLLDLHTIEPDDYVIASFYVENNGDTSARYWVKLYLDGNLYRQYQSTALAPGERSSAYNIHVSSDIYGSHTVLVEVNPFDTPVTDSVTDTFTVAEIPKITKQEFYDNLMAKLGEGGTINEAVIPEEYGDSSGNQDKWCKPPTASYIGWWSSKLYKHKKVLIAILLADGCSNPPDNVDCIYFTDWATYYTWNELPEEIVTEALDALPVTGSGKAVFDTGESSSPYPTISGVFRGKLKIKGEGYLKITDIKTRACSDTSAQVTSWSISPGKGNEIKRGTEYDIEVHLSGYPQMFHDVETIENSDGKLTFVSFTDANNNTHSNWIPSLIIEGETLPELTCSAPTPSFASGCELLLSYDKDSNGKIDITDMGIAWNDYHEKTITIREVDFLWAAWEKNSINAKCLGCFSPSKVSITFVTKAEDGSELREVKLYIDGDLIGETMPSLTVELEPGKTVHVKLVKEGYRTLEFDYTVPNTAATVTKTLVAEKPELKIINVYYSLNGGSTWTEVSREGTTNIPTGSKPKFKVRIRNEEGTSNRRCVWLKKGYGCATVNIGVIGSDKVLNYQDTEDIIFDATTGIEPNQNYSLHVKAERWLPSCPSDDEFDFNNVSLTIEVTFVTKDEQGNELRGVDVYIDGIKKGTT